ncbi:hypothetical protein L1987_32825 [Smallanthus sonchifolius]|uniref:Uncharacterized protein n=1 Tax=Smallanthus sonchifolius TaxID=185202 RepID=A0ACB9HPN5_9ASTR|nr:hypothetical protein L1987_32825 [Smallanthus sonchifolius]
MGIVSRGPTQTTPENTSIPPQQGPIQTGSQLLMSRLLAAQNIPYLPYTPYYPWQNMGMATTPFYQARPSVLSNPALRKVGRDVPQMKNGRVVLQTQSEDLLDEFLKPYRPADSDKFTKRIAEFKFPSKT